MFHYHRQRFGRLTSPGDRPARDPYLTRIPGRRVDTVVVQVWLVVVPLSGRWSVDKTGPHTTDERPLVPNGGAIRVELTKVKGESRVMAWSGRSTNDPKPLI